MMVPFLKDLEIQNKVFSITDIYCLENYLSEDGSFKYEIDVIKLTNLLGYRIKFCNLQDEFGVGVLGLISSDAKIIFCDKSIEPIGERKELKEKMLRFTIAHEIGHLVLHSDFINDHTSPAFHSKLPNKEKRRIEIQANLFASQLLMPEAKIKKAFQFFSIKHNIYFESKNLFENRKNLIQELSKYFNVSNTAINYRLKGLNLVDWLHYK